MTIHEKLKRLMETRNRSAVCRKAGVNPNFIFNILTRKSIPQVDTATKLAKALEVDVGWFVDDSREWPPVHIETSLLVNEPSRKNAA